MGEPEIMDLFPDSSGREGHADEISDEGYHYAGRSKINDYKHSSNNIHRQSEPYNQERYQEGYQDRSPYQDRNPQKKSYINVNDERIVWAGAIFVFFGVFIFLIGYWLGKTTLKDLALGNKQEVQKIEDKIDQKKMENNFAFNNLPQNFPQQEETKSVIPGDNATNMKIQDNVPENLTIPPIKGENSSKSEQKNVKLKTGLEKPSDKIKNSDKKQKSIKKISSGAEGKYTIQVSAHTSMEKAREVEDGLRKMGLESYLVEANVNGIIYYRVRVGKFATKEDADKAIQKIKESSLGRDSMILDLQ